MRCNKIFRILALGIILALMVVAIPATPALAAEAVNVNPDEGEIGDPVGIEGYGFNANEIVRIYFSSDKANVGGDIDKLDAYERVRSVNTADDGTFDTDFRVPYELTQGYHPEDVHGGDYYVYVTYGNSVRIEAIAQFTVINGEIELDPEEGPVGTEVGISGEGLRQGQKITIEYDEDDVAIARGDWETDSEGKLNCTIIIPESTVGNHTITVTDESGNKPEAEFSVKPKITIAPTSAAAGNAIEVSGTGFARKEYITITFDGYRVSTNPVEIRTNHKGSFSGNFLVPSYTTSGISEVRASDHSLNRAEADLTISAGISLSPKTSQTSPGHVGMELTVYGSGFIVNNRVTITYSNSVATATTDVYGNFRTTFTIPPSVAGSHIVTATDGENTVTSIFTMEAKAPPMPVPLLPKVAGMAEAEAYFDWEDVNDDSLPVTYTLQVAADADFTTIVLEKKGLSLSEFTITKEEKLEPTERKTPYYWRVKAVDGASNESEWTPPWLFYVGFSWALYILIGLGVLLLTILGFWVRRRATQR